ncbi:MAG: CCA tRNA nucleotidyltransferase [Bulleidia sp.]|nr:CCA tRNA nucleotidyltransferase [Bulleidia sp.]
MNKSFSLPNYVKTAIRTLNDAGYEAWLVGGAVRSMILGKAVNDYDIATSAKPWETERAFRGFRVIETGIKHGTVTVMIAKHPLEITTYRTEGEYEDHRHPDIVRFSTSLEDDCARRDFTMNAICYHPKEGLKDFYGGIQDLQNFVIRTIGDPDARFNEDALRILRAVRFAAQLGFDIDPDTSAALMRHIDDLYYIAMERINSELYKTLEAPYFKDVLAEFDSIIVHLIPEIREIDETTWQGVRYNISHSPNDAMIRTALLLAPLHDATRSESTLRRLKCTNQFIFDIMDLLKYGTMPLNNKLDLLRILNRIHIPFETYAMYRCSINPAIKKENLMQAYQELLDEKQCWNIKQLAIKGNDLKAIGLKGEAISIGMQACLREVMEGRLSNTKEELLGYLESMRA